MDHAQSHVIAYGLVEMNRESIALESVDDYYKLAKRFYENAKEYYELCEQAMPLLYKGNWALSVNISFIIHKSSAYSRASFLLFCC